MFQRIVPCVLVTAAFAIPALAANVTVCTPSNPPGGALQTTVNAASDGDILLLKNGSYQAFTITNKSLVLIAEVGANVTINGNCVVQDVDLTHEVLASNLHFRGNASGGQFTYALTLRDSVGTIRLQDCSIDGGTQNGVPGGCDRVQSGLSVSSCADVGLSSCVIRATQPNTENVTAQGIGLTLNASSIALSDCAVLGSHGGSDECDKGNGEGTWGGIGMRISAGCQAWLSGTSVAGGTGGAGDVGHFGRGGDGVVLLGGSELHLLESPLTAGGSDDPLADPGVALDVVNNGTVVNHPGPARHLTGSTLVRSGQQRTFTFTGNPGDNVAVYTSGLGEWTFDPNANWIRLVATVPVARLLRFGFVPGSGDLTISVPAGPMAPGVQGVSARMQSAQRDSGGMLFYGPARFFVIVDAAF